MEVVDEIRGFIVENFLFGDTGVQIGDTESLLQNRLVDSTGILEVVAFIEERFGFAVEDEELIPENLDSIRSIADFVLRKQRIVA